MARKAPSTEASGRVFGYGRVSTKDQDLKLQEAALKAAGAVFFGEKRSGTSMAGREQLDTLLNKVLQPGDTLLVTRLDRLGRSLADLAGIIDQLKARGVTFRAIEQPGVELGTAAGNCFLGMLAVCAEFETNIRRERQREGIEQAKAEGRYKGRPPTVDVYAVRRLKAEGHTIADIARELDIGRASVYRALAQ